ncbi:hypothetical protein E4U43_006279 [Claviceps pusilla]|uniref:Uncharacterized protein n=1 Tax=Claviceps pusilla TaxID=123648 RepID=A0A9P7N3X4_9HYPO|nr:hypothetical protein E4U43_006279 [Claviceps pusilla]
MSPQDESLSPDLQAPGPGTASGIPHMGFPWGRIWSGLVWSGLVRPPKTETRGSEITAQGTLVHSRRGEHRMCSSRVAVKSLDG